MENWLRLKLRLSVPRLTGDPLYTCCRNGVEFSLSLEELLEAVNKRPDRGLLHLERRSQTWWNLLSRLYQIDNNQE